jgi:hypothetical protein
MWTLWITREKIIFITHIIILTRVGGHRHVQTRAPYDNGAVIANQAFCQDSCVRWRQGLPHAVDLPKYQVALEFASCKGRAAYVPCGSRSSPCKGQSSWSTNCPCVCNANTKYPLSMTRYPTKTSAYYFPHNQPFNTKYILAKKTTLFFFLSCNSLYKWLNYYYIVLIYNALCPC